LPVEYFRDQSQLSMVSIPVMIDHTVTCDLKNLF
jgi:hypothetical protein